MIVDKHMERPDDAEEHCRAMRSLRRILTEEDGRELIGNSGVYIHSRLHEPL
jgi:F0F1-type ATP synthase alpha subunit